MEVHGATDYILYLGWYFIASFPSYAIIQLITFPSPLPEKKKTQTYKQKNKLFVCFFRPALYLEGSNFNEKDFGLLAWIAGVSAGCANAFFSDNVFILL